MKYMRQILPISLLFWSPASAMFMPGAQLHARQIAVITSAQLQAPTITSPTLSLTTTTAPASTTNGNSTILSTNTMNTSTSIVASINTQSSSPSPSLAPPPTRSNGLSTSILTIVILAGFALVAITALVVWLHHRKASNIAKANGPDSAKSRRKYAYPEDEAHWDDGSGARTLQRVSLAAKRASSVFGSKKHRVGGLEGDLAQTKHVRIRTKDSAATKNQDGKSVYEGI